jgi:hypothetical protein
MEKEMPSGSTGTSLIAGTMALAPLAALLLAGCSEKEMACERAVKADLKNPTSYRTINIKEEPGEGAAFDGYLVEYSYLENNNSVHGERSCLYYNNKSKAYTEIPTPQF